MTWPAPRRLLLPCALHVNAQHKTHAHPSLQAQVYPSPPSHFTDTSSIHPFINPIHSVSQWMTTGWASTLRVTLSGAATSSLGQWPCLCLDALLGKLSARTPRPPCCQELSSTPFLPYSTWHCSNSSEALPYQALYFLQFNSPASLHIPPHLVQNPWSSVPASLTNLNFPLPLLPVCK